MFHLNVFMLSQNSLVKGALYHLHVCLIQGIPKKLWNLGHLNHVAIAVPNLEKSVALYRDVLGAKVSDPHVSKQFMYIYFFMK